MNDAKNCGITLQPMSFKNSIVSYRRTPGYQNHLTKKQEIETKFMQTYTRRFRSGPFTNIPPLPSWVRNVPRSLKRGRCHFGVLSCRRAWFLAGTTQGKGELLGSEDFTAEQFVAKDQTASLTTPPWWPSSVRCFITEGWLFEKFEWGVYASTSANTSVKAPHQPTRWTRKWRHCHCSRLNGTC